MGSTGNTLGHDEVDVAVVGGGLAGLVAAATAACAGRRVVVLEAGAHLGGRAATVERSGYLLNAGPHALYERGVGMTVLAGLGVDPPGERPPIEGTRGRRGQQLHLLPTGPLSMARSRLLGPKAKAELARFFRRVASAGPDGTGDLAGLSVADWLDDQLTSAAARDVVLTIVRLASYAHAPEVMSADAAATQLRVGAGGVRYLHGGWGALVGAVRAAAVRAGAGIRTGAGVTGLDAGPGGWTVRTAGGAVRASAVVLGSGGPEQAARLLDLPGSCFDAGPPVTASVLDVGLRRPPRHRIVLGVDRPLYLSTHCPPADLAPPGRSLVTLLRYHAPGERPDRASVRAELADHLAAAGVASTDVELDRYLHRMVVANGLPTAPGGGLRGRPGVAVAGRPGVFVAGDWVGSVGLLADAALASGRGAARAALAHLDRAPVRVP